MPRKAAADKLARLAEAQINSLAMTVRFEVGVQSAEELNRTIGRDSVGQGPRREALRRTHSPTGLLPAGTKSNTASRPIPASR